jgi:hypothetical protein
MNKKMIASTIVFFLSHLISAMDGLTKDELIFGLVTTNYLSNHKAICAYAATSKKNNKFMIDLAPSRTRQLNCIDFVPLPSPKWLHKYGSARWIFSKCKDVFTVDYRELSDDGISKKRIIQEGFISQLPHKPAPFFNEDGHMCFYGYGEIENNKIPSIAKAVLQYGEDGSIYNCVVQGEDDHPWSIAPLLSYPSLLKALLITEGKKAEIPKAPMPGPFLVFSFDNVVIPDNYREFKGFGVEWYSILQFTHFPQCIQNTVEERYKKQQKNKATR